MITYLFCCKILSFISNIFYLIVYIFPLKGYSAGWHVCSKLGESDGYSDLAMRQELMAFARTYCPPNVIQSLMAVSSSLQTQVGVNILNFTNSQRTLALHLVSPFFWPSNVIFHFSSQLFHSPFLPLAFVHPSTT